MHHLSTFPPYSATTIRTQHNANMPSEKRKTEFDDSPSIKKHEPDKDESEEDELVITRTAVVPHTASTRTGVQYTLWRQDMGMDFKLPEHESPVARYRDDPEFWRQSMDEIRARWPSGVRLDDIMLYLSFRFFSRQERVRKFPYDIDCKGTIRTARTHFGAGVCAVYDGRRTYIAYRRYYTLTGEDRVDNRGAKGMQIARKSLSVGDPCVFSFGTLEVGSDDETTAPYEVAITSAGEAQGLERGEALTHEPVERGEEKSIFLLTNLDKPRAPRTPRSVQNSTPRDTPTTPGIDSLPQPSVEPSILDSVDTRTTELKEIEGGKQQSETPHVLNQDNLESPMHIQDLLSLDATEFVNYSRSMTDLNWQATAFFNKLPSWDIEPSDRQSDLVRIKSQFLMNIFRQLCYCWRAQQERVEMADAVEDKIKTLQRRNETAVDASELRDLRGQAEKLVQNQPILILIQELLWTSTAMRKTCRPVRTHVSVQDIAKAVWTEVLNLDLVVSLDGGPLVELVETLAGEVMLDVKWQKRLGERMTDKVE